MAIMRYKLKNSKKSVTILFREMTHTFETLADIQAFAARETDRPVAATTVSFDSSTRLNIDSYALAQGRFTNSYDFSFSDDAPATGIAAFDNLTSAYDHLRAASPSVRAVCSGGFFFLADQASAQPRQLALNLSMSNGSLHSLPTRDQETVVTRKSGITAQYVLALGELTLDNRDLTWSGSNTTHETDVKVFGNGNAVIKHITDQSRCTSRVLDEDSRFTPKITDSSMVDIGFIGLGGNQFEGVQQSDRGELDIFTHDFVLRCDKRFGCAKTPRAQIHSVGALTVDSELTGAFSAGPLLSTTDFDAHPINQDASLGSRPPFNERPMARIVLYKTADGLKGIRLFDGRPSSPAFSGVTPAEAKSILMNETKLDWGCFLDSGQSAKLCVNLGSTAMSFGNRHYVEWPNEQNKKFIWTPETGRPIANVITL